MHRSNSPRPRVRRRPGGLLVLWALLPAALLLGGCTQQRVAQVPIAAQVSSPTVPASATATAGAPSTEVATATSRPEGTPTVRPTPTGPAPSPIDVLNLFTFYSGEDTLVKSDLLKLNGTDPGEVLFTITGAREVITTENKTFVSVLTYDKVYREWNNAWRSEPVSGTASPLASVGQASGYNGGDLLRTGSPIIMARTTTRDNRAHLYMWRWNKDKHAAENIMMVPAGGGPPKAADFVGDLDVNVADLNNDGVYEVVADNLRGVQVWKWDGSKYAPQGGR